jgi:hypothetical protein
MILELIDKAMANGARLKTAAGCIGLTARTIIRWRGNAAGEDQRHGPQRAPANKLSEAEREKILAVATSPSFRDLLGGKLLPSFKRTSHAHSPPSRKARHDPATACARGHRTLPGVELGYHVFAHIGSGNVLLPVPVP